MELKNRTVIITGASSGTGQAAAKKFAKKKAHLVLAARRLEKLNALRRELETECICVRTDVSKEGDVIQLFNEAEETFGNVDVLVNCAGRGLRADLCSINVEDWDAVFDVNVKGVFLCTREAVKRMLKKSTKGHIITISSVAGLFGAPNYAAYCASKHAVTGFKKAIRWELSRKIKISTIHPARIDTEFFKDYPYDKKPKKWQMLSAEDVADVIVAMAERNILKVQYYRARNILKRMAALFRR